VDQGGGYSAVKPMTDSDRHSVLGPLPPNRDPFLMADYDADPIWSSSRTARQIHDLGRVEKVGSLTGHPTIT
jgi:hypothetical protein